MRTSPRRSLLLLAAAAALAAPALLARAADAPPLPKPPETPLPSYENPLSDCEVGETLFYRVKDVGKEDGWVRYFEERVLARTKDRALLEVIETDATGTKEFDVDNVRTRWRPIPAKFVLPPACRWLEEKTKQVVLYVGDPPTKAIRCTQRFLEEPVYPDRPDGEKRVRQIWYSHDLPASGVAKMFPAQREGERYVISWGKRLSSDECAKRAARYPDQDAQATPQPGAGMGEGKPEPGMDEPKPEPGMDEPKPEPGMEEPKPDGGGMS